MNNHYNIFISYSKADKEIVLPLVDKINEEVGTKCWIDDSSIINEEDYEEKIKQAIDYAKIVLFILSDNSVKSEWNKRELEYADFKGKQIIPVVIDGGGLRKWFESCFGNLRFIDINSDEQWKKFINDLRDSICFKQCPNGHYYQGKKCPFCKDASGQSTETTTGSGETDADTNKTYIRTVFGDESDEDIYNKNYYNKNQYGICVSKKIVGRLVTVYSENYVEEYKICEGRNLIGRDANCNITIADGMVSREHAILLYKHDVFKIVDRYSSHGTYVNGIDIVDEPCVLNNGDIITIGKTGLKFIDESSLEEEQQQVYSSIFAPAEVKRKSHMLVQVYLHLFEETGRVKELAKESDKNTDRRDYIPLQCKLKKGDVVDIVLNIYGETLLMSDKKSVVWQSSITKCSFDYFVPNGIDVEELSCVALLTVNGIPVGEMRFISKIVETPCAFNTNIFARKYNKIFISYSHHDESKVKFLAEGFKVTNTDYFFDRHYLQTGDIYPQKIQDYIDSADLFVLCWSENASKSEYVEKERKQALERAFPKVKPQQAAKLSIYPMSIEPGVELPADMKEYYHFGEI